MDKPHIEALVALGAVAASPDWMAVQEKAQAAVNAVYELREYVIAQQRSLDAARARIKELEALSVQWHCDNCGEEAVSVGYRNEVVLRCTVCGTEREVSRRAWMRSSTWHHAALSAKGGSDETDC